MSGQIRKQMQVYTPVKNLVQELKTENKFSNESEVITYLYCIYKQNYKNITIDAHKKAIEEMKHILNQSQI